MPRPERRIDGQGDALVQFALALRELRAGAGDPGYRELARRALYSASTLSEAAAGRRLPTLDVALAYVRACGGDPAVWEKRWRRLAVDLAPPEPETTDAASPYLGLRSFHAEDAGRFFGRERLVRELLGRLGRRRFLAVFGPSGSGKSSVLRAGLMSAAVGAESDESRRWVAVLFTPGENPLQECAVRLAGLLGVTAGTLYADLVADPRTLDLAVRQILADRPDGAEMLLVVDQFEELFTLCCDAGPRRAFVEALLAATNSAASRARVVVGVRADFYGRCAELPELVEAMQDAQVLVGSMTAEELRAAITQPAVRAGLTVESTLVSTIITEMIGRPGALPLMSHALLETWQRRRGTTLTLVGYEAAGGIDGALSRSAEHAYMTLDSEQQRAARQILLRLTALGEGTEDTRRRLRRSGLAENATATDVLHQLAQARLLTLGDDTVEISHEALIRSWPRLRAWLAQDREGLRLHQQLTDAAAAWRDEHRDPGLLYRGNRLSAAEEWFKDHRDDVMLSGHVHDFLAASTRHRRRTGALRRSAIAAVTVFALLATVAAIFAFQQRSTAQAQRDSAIFNQLSGEADRLRGSDVTLAAQLDLVAHRMRPTDEKIYTDLVGTENFPLSTPVLGHTDAVRSVAFSPDGRILASAGADRTIRLWDVADPGPAGPSQAQTITTPGAVNAVAFSPDGRILASADVDTPSGSGTSPIRNTSCLKASHFPMPMP